MESDYNYKPLSFEDNIKTKITSILYMNAGLKIEFAIQLANKITEIKEIRELLKVRGE